MKKAVIYIRYSSKTGLDYDGQRREILARFGEVSDGGTSEIQDRLGLKATLDAVAKGEVEALVCSDITRLTQSLSPEIIGAIQRAGIKIVTVDGSELDGQKPNDE